jgi:branched-chain amino acid aminotransferase
MSAPASDPASIELRPTTNPCSAEERRARLQAPGFGRLFTDHMVTSVYTPGEGWRRAVLGPYANISLPPSASVLHYGQAIFEGFKAYRQGDGSVATFRPIENARRFNLSARRLAMRELPEETFIAAADALIRQDAAWIPEKRGESLYLRPVMIGTDPALGVRPSNEYLFYLIASPSGDYFPNGVKPVTVWLSDEYVRAAPGGTGAAKFAGNYAASLLAQKEALAQGCDQVVWLDAIERKFVEEMGGMNIFFVFKDNGKVTLVTPELTGTLLPGITRKSIVTLARDRGYNVEERRFSREEWETSLKQGRMTEAFACGTAAVITPIATVKSQQGSWTIADGGTGPIASQLRETLLDIQYGTGPDPHGWMHKVP